MHESRKLQYETAGHPCISNAALPNNRPLLIMKTIQLIYILVGRAISSAIPVNVPFNASYAMQSFSKEPISDVMQNKNINWTRSESPIWIKMSTARTSIRTMKICFQIFSDRWTNGENINARLKNVFFKLTSIKFKNN